MATTGALIDLAPWTFFGAPSVRDLDALDAQVAFLGVPYDGGTPEPGVPTGQRAGPEAARTASREQISYPPSPAAEANPGADGWYDVEADRDYLVGVTMADVGDVTIQGSDTESNYKRITAVARRIAELGALLVAIGGDHSISYPLGRGMEPLGEFDVVHVDAHTDALDELGGTKLTGASQLRRLAELPFVGTVSALGVRNVARAEVDGLRDLGGRWSWHVSGTSIPSVCASVIPMRVAGASIWRPQEPAGGLESPGQRSAPTLAGGGAPHRLSNGQPRSRFR